MGIVSQCPLATGLGDQDPVQMAWLQVAASPQLGSVDEVCLDVV